MRQAVPVSATSRNPAEPVGDLLAEFFWVTATGQVAKVLTSAPVQNGVAIYDGPSLEPGLYWAIRLQQVGTPGAVFRSGPLRRLPGPPSPALTGRVSLLFSPRIAFSLTSTGSDGLPEIVAEQLQNLPAPLQFGGVTLSSDQFGNYLVTVRGRVRLAFFELPFAYTRALQLVGSLDPGRTSPVILAQPVGTPTVSGPYVLPYAAVLDRLIVDAVQHQFDAAVTRIASIELELAGASFLAQTVSVVAIQLVPYPTEVQAELSALCGGAVTGIIGPPMPDVAGSA